VFYISGTWVGIYWLYVFAGKFVNDIDYFIDGYGLAAGDIQDLASGVLCPCGK